MVAIGAPDDPARHFERNGDITTTTTQPLHLRANVTVVVCIPERAAADGSRNPAL